MRTMPPAQPFAVVDATHWPYPRWIAHRGAGRLAPENTLAAFRAGHAHGYRMFECDVRLSADGVPFLLHDDVLDRTTDGRGEAAALAWDELSVLDAGAWHSAKFRGERLLSLQALVRFCQIEDCALNVELKPAPGTEYETGRIVARMLEREWGGRLPPLLSSFRVEALRGACAGGPSLPRALLIGSPFPDCLRLAKEQACIALVAGHEHVSPSFVQQVRAEGLALLSYTVNDEAEARRLLQLGLHGLITDCVDCFDPGRQAA